MNKTLRPLFGLAAVAFAAHASAQITFYEGEGLPRPHLRSQRRSARTSSSTGFNDRASSVVVDRGRWEVCEDARFQGRCVVLRRGSYDSLRGMGMENRISSVRRVADRPPVRQRGASARSPTPSYEYRRRPNERLREVPVTSARAVMGPPEQRCWVERAAGRRASATSTCRARSSAASSAASSATRSAAAPARPSRRSAARSAAARSAPTSTGSATRSPGQDVRRCENVAGQHASVLGRHLQLPGRPAPRADDLAAGPDHHRQQLQRRAAPLIAPASAQVIDGRALRRRRSRGRRRSGRRSAISGASAACVSTLLARRVGLEALEVDAERRAFGAGARQAKHDARAVVEDDADALLRRHRAVDRIGVGEVVGRRRSTRVSALERSARQRGRAARAGRPSGRWPRPASTAFVVVARIVVAAEARASGRGRSLDRLAGRAARMLSQNSTAHRPSFSRTWSEPVPALSSPHSVAMPASSRLPKNFQPVGVS